MKFGNWSVNVDGIQWTGSKGMYPLIEKDRLEETGSGSRSEMYDWLVHMPSKTWLTIKDVEDLNEAFIFAMKHFKYEINKDYFNNSLAEQKKELKRK